MESIIKTKTGLEQHFAPFREKIVGSKTEFITPYGKKPLIYADWTASGRLYAPIEEKLSYDIGAYVGNTHTETSTTGTAMTKAYHRAKKIIKKHVNASESDVLISSNSGMTGVINKFQRILGLKLHERFDSMIELAQKERPIVFVTHMEHHSNQTSWLETIADVVVIKATDEGLVDLDDLVRLVNEYPERTKIAAVTSCSNVTGIITPYQEIAKIMHQNDGLCFVDFACSAPYIKIDMNPSEPLERLDAIYFSPHKFLGGPGSAGVLVFKAELYKNRVPDNPGGGTVNWTNPWGEHSYIIEIEAREDGGTPSFLQTMRTALSIQLKEDMGIQKIRDREAEQMNILWPRMKAIKSLHLLADNQPDRLGVISFYFEDIHYNLAVKLLNDRFGIQTRGGCSCAGTYGHYLLEVSHHKSKNIVSSISHGDLSQKPGWVRLSIHPTMTNAEILYIADALKSLAENHKQWSADYIYDLHKNEFYHQSNPTLEIDLVDKWFGRPKG